jgi:hypothetical protein
MPTELVRNVGSNVLCRSGGIEMWTVHRVQMGFGGGAHKT